jgi:hypothetical protein
MFSPTKPSQPSRDIYYVCIGSTSTSNVTQSSMTEYGKVSYGGYVSEK